MRLLDRYLLRELLIPLGYCLSGFLIFWIAFDLFNNLDSFNNLRLKGLQVAHYYLLKTPELMFTVLPVSLLLALLYTLTTLARHNELVAMRAAGVGLWRISMPYLAVGFLCSVLLFVVCDIWLTDSSDKADDLITLKSKGAASGDRLQKSLNFRNEQIQRSWSIGVYNVTRKSMTNIVVEWPTSDGGRRFISANSAVWTNQNWTFENVNQFRYQTATEATPTLEQFPTLEMRELSETPAQIESEIKVSNLTKIAAARRVRLTVGEIVQYLKLHPDLTGPTKALVLTQLHGRLAAPWTCLVVVLIAVPFGTGGSRRNALVGVASSLVICFTFFVLSRFSLAFGTSGHLPSWLAAWLPNLFFAMLGSVLITRGR